MSAVTELQSLEREIAILKTVLKSCSSSTTEATSVAALRIYTAITTSTQNNNKVILDHFAPLPIPKGGGTGTTTTTTAANTNTSTNSQSRTTYNPDEPSDGCCVVC